jgi:hypothetical protein
VLLVVVVGQQLTPRLILQAAAEERHLWARVMWEAQELAHPEEQEAQPPLQALVLLAAKIC